MERRKFDNSGIAFKNDRQRPDKRDADFTGSITVEGKDYWLNIWKKTGPKGTYLTSTVKPKIEGAMRDQRNYYNQIAPDDNQQAPQRPPQRPAQQQRPQYQERPRNNFRDDMDDDIPF